MNKSQKEELLELVKKSQIVSSEILNMFLNPSDNIKFLLDIKLEQSQVVVIMALLQLSITMTSETNFGKEWLETTFALLKDAIFEDKNNVDFLALPSNKTIN